MSKHLTPAGRRARDRAIYALFLRGHAPPAIVEELQTSLPAVRRAIARGEAETAARFANGDRMRLLQTEQLSFLYQEALAAWEESKKGNEITKVSTAAEGDTGKRRAEKTTRKQAGDPRFLSQAMSALADLRRPWRLDAATKEETPTPDTLTIEEDARWYGNDAHDLATQTAAAPTADPAFAGPVQGGRLR